VSYSLFVELAIVFFRDAVHILTKVAVPFFALFIELDKWIYVHFALSASHD
jgi:hypothetical protein